jgi:tight adherence protein C
MFDLFYAKLTDSQFLLSVLVAIATMATIVTVAMPLIETDTLAQRMKAVATERERIRARERERLLADKGKANLRQAPKAYMKRIVERFSLSKWLGTEQAKAQMAMAGFRGPQAEVAFLFFRHLTNTIGKRQHSIGRAFPDAMDLLLICVESGMSIEHAFRKVAQEIGVQSIPLAEELTLTDRRTFFFAGPALRL